MTLQEYQELAMRTKAGYENQWEQFLCAVLGLVGESGELAEATKKHLYQGHDMDAEVLLGEAGDVLWYVALFCDALGVDMSEIAHNNIEKLRTRYPDGFEAKRSVNRKG